MNYIKEINAFFELMEREPMSASAVNLWHTLLHINNKARWSIEFTATSTVLKLKGGLSESSFQRARKELINRGLVASRSRGQNLAPAYQMKRLYLEYEEGVENKEVEESGEELARRDVISRVDSQVEKQTGMQEDAQVKVQAEGQMKGQVNEQEKGHANQHTEALIKQKEIKRRETKQEVDAYRFYQENFGVVSPFVTEDILGWVEDVGEVLVVEAMKRGLERNKSNWGYVKSILRSWVKKGIRTVEAARAEMVGMDTGIVSSGKGSSGEVVPEWFLEQKRKRKMMGKTEGSFEVGEDVGVTLERYLSGRPGWK